MKRAFRYLGVGLLAVGFFATFQVVAILNGWPEDKYRFLEYVGRTRAEILPENASGRPVTEVRVYSWPADYSTIREAAIKELEPSGYKIEDHKGPETVLADGKGRVVMIANGKSNRDTDVFTFGFESEPGWVTVVLASPAPQNWATPIRVAFAKPM